MVFIEYVNKPNEVHNSLSTDIFFYRGFSVKPLSDTRCSFNREKQILYVLIRSITFVRN